MNALVTEADAPAVELSPEIADAVLAEAAGLLGAASPLDLAIAQLDAIEPEFRRLAKAHTAAEDAAIALRDGSDAELDAAAAAVEAAEAAWIAVQDRRIALALAVLKVPAAGPVDLLRKLDAYAKAFDVQTPRALYDRGDMALAVEAVMADIAAMRDADLELLTLGTEFERRNDIEQLAYANKCSDEEAEAACEYTGVIAKRIMATPARTVAGLRTKGKVIAWCFSLQSTTDFMMGGDEYSTSHVYADRFFADLLSAAPTLPAVHPIDFASGLARYDEMNAVRAALPHDRPSDVFSNDLYEAQFDQLKQVLRAPCSTLPGAAAKVKGLLRLMERGGGSDWTDEHDKIALEQLDAFFGGLLGDANGAA